MKKIILLIWVILLCFTEAKGVNKKTKGIYDSILKYFIEGYCQNAEEQESIKEDVAYFDGDFVKIFNIYDFINNNTPCGGKDISDEFGIYFIKHKNKKDFKELFIVTYKGKTTLFYRADVWFVRYILQLSYFDDDVSVSDELMVKLAYYYAYPDGNSSNSKDVPEIRQVGAIHYLKEH